MNSTLQLRFVFVLFLAHCICFQTNADELIQTGTKKDPSGAVYMVYQQAFDGVPVYGSEVLLKHNDELDNQHIAMRTLKTLRVTTTPSLSRKQARKIARNALKKTSEWDAQRSRLRKRARTLCKEERAERRSCIKRRFKASMRKMRPRTVGSDLYIYDVGFINGRSEAVLQYLVYKVSFARSGKRLQKQFYVNALNGEIVSGEIPQADICEAVSPEALGADLKARCAFFDNPDVPSSEESGDTPATQDVTVLPLPSIQVAFEVCASVPGDYDGNGTVESADYDVWVSNYGQSGPNPADGNGDGDVNAADYTIYRDNLGKTSRCNLADVNLDQNAFYADLSDRISVEVMPLLSPIIAVENGTATGFRIKYKRTDDAPLEIQEPPVPGSPSLVDYCQEASGYGPVQTISDFNLDISSFADGYISLCVRGEDSLGFGKAYGYAWLKDTMPPGAFDVTGPAPSPIDVPDFDITWNASVGAVGYQLQVSQQSDCSLPFIEETVMGTSYSITGATDGDFYVCVTAENANGTPTQASNHPFNYEVDLPSDPPQLLFVTSSVHFIDGFTLIPPAPPFFNTVEAADWLCNEYAFNIGMLPGWDGVSLPYRALLSNSFRNAADLVKNNGVVTINGDIIAVDKADLFDGTIGTQILDENGNVPTGTTRVWTGSTSQGINIGINCGDWTLAFSGTGAYGDVSSLGADWMEQGIQSCPDPTGGRLYCISP